MIDMTRSMMAAGAKLTERWFPRASVTPRDTLEWVRQLTTVAEFHQALPVIEHLFGVIPILERFFDDETTSDPVLKKIGQGEALACLGLFTPTPQFSWISAAVRAEAHENQWLLSGDVRIIGSGPEWVVALVENRSGERRLALVSLRAQGVTVTDRRGSGRPSRTRRRSTDSDRVHAAWLLLDGSAVEPAFLSTPVDVRPLGDCWRALDDYAGVYAFTAAVYAKQGVRALRRALRTTAHGKQLFNTSQVLAMGLTELEIRTNLLESSTRAYFSVDSGHPSRVPGLTLAASASRILSEVVGMTRELRGKAGLPCAGPFGDRVDPAASELVDMMLGGQLVIESELAHMMGI